MAGAKPIFIPKFPNQLNYIFSLMNTKEFTRQELYDLVWSTPLRTLAIKYVVSDNGLRKMCRKYNVPLPSQGHWQKLRYGKKSRAKKLPAAEKFKDVFISLDEREATDGSEDHYFTRLTRLTKEIEKDDSLPLLVPEKLIKPDPLVKEARSEISKRRKESYALEYGLLRPTRSGLSISVAPSNVKRALLFMDALIKLFKARGHKTFFTTTLIS